MGPQADAPVSLESLSNEALLFVAFEDRWTHADAPYLAPKI